MFNCCINMPLNGAMASITLYFIDLLHLHICILVFKIANNTASVTLTA